MHFYIWIVLEYSVFDKLIKFLNHKPSLEINIESTIKILKNPQKETNHKMSTTVAYYFTTYD